MSISVHGCVHKHVWIQVCCVCMFCVCTSMCAHITMNVVSVCICLQACVWRCVVYVHVFCVSVCVQSCVHACAHMLNCYWLTCFNRTWPHGRQVCSHSCIPGPRPLWCAQQTIKASEWWTYTLLDLFFHLIFLIDFLWRGCPHGLLGIPKFFRYGSECLL